MGFCGCGADALLPSPKDWQDHPIRHSYELLKDLGAGSFSQVVLAQHKKTRELVALKVCFLDGPEVDAGHVEAMLREPELLKALEHPGIVALKDVIRDHKQLVMVLEWLRGGQVIDCLRDLGPQYSEQTACDIFTQVAQTLEFMHGKGVLHRDIKPENILFLEPPAPPGNLPTPVGLTVAQLQQRAAAAAQASARGPHVLPGSRPGSNVPRVKLIDLGMACIYDPRNPPVQGAVGSAGFVAPEVARGSAHTPAMDVFSAGMLLFVMVVGRKPFNMKQTETLEYAFLSLKDAPGFNDPRWLELSPDAKDLITRMLAYDPKRRITAAEVLRHEWVTSSGGRLPRVLAADVVLGAATVASIRRLKHLCGGVVTLVRVAEAAAEDDGSGAASRRPRRRCSSAGGGAGPVAALEDSARQAYVRRQRLAQRQGNAAGSGGALSRLARQLAGQSYAKLHDAGAVVHPEDDIGSYFYTLGAKSCGPCRTDCLQSAAAATSGGGAGDLPSTSRSTSGRWRLARAVAPASLARSATTVLLSEMQRSRGGPNATDWRRDENPSLHGGLQRHGSSGNILGSRVAEGSSHVATGQPAAASARGARAGRLAQMRADSAQQSECAAGDSPESSSPASDAGVSMSGPAAELAAAAAAAAAAAGPSSPSPPHRPSTMQLLATAAKSYLDSSLNGSGHLKMATACSSLPSVAAAGSGSNNGAGAGAAAAAAASDGLTARRQAGPRNSSNRSGSGGLSLSALPSGVTSDGSYSSISSISNADPSGRPLLVVRRTVENPLLAPQQTLLRGSILPPRGNSPPLPSMTWTEVQALHLRSGTPRLSRDASPSGRGTPRKVNVVKPLQ